MPNSELNPDADPALRRSLMVAGGLSVAAAAGVGALLAGGLGLSVAAPLKAAGVVVALLAIVGRRINEHPYTSLGPANLLTLSRSVLVGALAAFLMEGREHGALLAVGALVALALDGVDGWLARRTRMSSNFGAQLDMELDALTVLVLSGLCWQLGKAGPWILAAGAMRYVYVAATMALPWLGGALFDSYARKAVCGIQVGTMAICLFPFVPVVVSAPALALSLVALTWSFGRDIVWLYRRR